MKEGIEQLQVIGLRLIFLLIVTPFAGYLFLRLAEATEKAWKSGNKKKRWLVMCELFFIIAVISGWLR